MTEILIIRDRIARFLREYETWTMIIAKFLGMLLVFHCINDKLGYFTQLDNILIEVFLSLICSIIPGSFIIFIVSAVVIAHMVKLSVVLAAITLVMILIVYLLFLSFAPDQCFVLLAVPVLIQYNLEYMIPMIAGVLFTPYAVVPAVAGLFMVKFLGYTIDAVSLTGTGMSVQLEGISAAVTQIITNSITDKTIWLFAVVTAVTLAVMFILSQFTFDYAWYVAIFAGAIAEFAAAFFSSGVLGTGDMFKTVMIGTIAGFIAACFIQFFKCVVDYSRKEYVQFEDDDYYYYVKAIPKISERELKKRSAKAASAADEDVQDVVDDEADDEADLDADDEADADDQSATEE